MTDPENTTIPAPPESAPPAPSTQPAPLESPPAPPAPSAPSAQLESPPAPPVPRVSAVLDSAHVGDIEGALGRIRVTDTDSGRTLKTRLLTLLAILGPGLIVMVGDNDAGGVATYAQAGQDYEIGRAHV